MIELKTDQEKETARKVEELLREYPGLKEIHNNPKLTPFQRKMKAIPILRGIRQKLDQDIKHVAKLDERIKYLERVKPVADLWPEWKKLPPKLEKNDCSRLHQLISALKLQYKYMPEAIKGGNPLDYPWDEVTPFVVEHDWAAAFKNATDYNEGSFNLPYERCAFEFRISGRSVTVLAGQEDDEHEPTYTFYIAFQDFWIGGGPDEKDDHPPAFDFAISQIKAICVALDAEVATRNVVRASEGVNKKRVAEGREPFYSYHVVSLARRIRVANPYGGSGAQTRRRLHFRRGHWRHYEKFKTWVRWCLVGDPDLGFVDKEYRL